jgi:hypothetical protein
MKAAIVTRWLFVLSLWIVLFPYGVWGLRAEIPLWREYFTWSSLRYGMYYHPWASLALVLCIAYTCAVLVWHSHKLLKGWSARETYRFKQEAAKIAQNPRHWLWLILKRI